MRKTYISAHGATVSTMAALLFAMCNLAACGSRPDLDVHAGVSGADPTDVTSTGAGGATGGEGGAGATGGADPGSGSGGASGGGPTCRATCATALGPLEVFHSKEDANKALAGRWQICSKSASSFPPTIPSDVIGFEAEPNTEPSEAAGWSTDGTLHYLVEGPGGPMRGPGFDYQVSYRFIMRGGVVIDVDLFRLPNAVVTNQLVFSTCPRRWDFGLDNISTHAVLAPF